MLWPSVLELEQRRLLILKRLINLLLAHTHWIGPFQAYEIIIVDVVIVMIKESESSSLVVFRGSASAVAKGCSESSTWGIWTNWQIMLINSNWGLNTGRCGRRSSTNRCLIEGWQRIQINIISKSALVPHSVWFSFMTVTGKNYQGCRNCNQVLLRYLSNRG